MTSIDLSKAEKCVYCITTVLTILGVTLCVVALMIPDWVEVQRVIEPVTTKTRFGLWNYEICDHNHRCATYWGTFPYYGERNESNPDATFKSRDIICGIETFSVVFGVTALVSLVPLWMSRIPSVRRIVQTVFVAHSLIAAIMGLTGKTVLSKNVDGNQIGLAPFLSGGGTALVFVSAILLCVHCRNDATMYGARAEDIFA